MVDVGELKFGVVILVVGVALTVGGIALLSFQNILYFEIQNITLKFKDPVVKDYVFVKPNIVIVNTYDGKQAQIVFPNMLILSEERRMIGAVAFTIGFLLLIFGALFVHQSISDIKSE